MLHLSAGGRLLLAAGAVLLLLAFSGQCHAARRSRTERKALHEGLLLRPAPPVDAPKLLELLSVHDCFALAPEGMELGLLRSEPSRFMQGEGLTLESADSSLLTLLKIEGFLAEGDAAELVARPDPCYTATLTLRKLPSGRAGELLQSFDSIAHSAGLRALEAPLPTFLDPAVQESMESDLGIAGNDRLSKGREFMRWETRPSLDCRQGRPAGCANRHWAFDDLGAEQVSGELQAVLKARGEFYLISLRFESEGCHSVLVLSRNLAACAASRLTGRRFRAWHYQDPARSEAEALDSGEAWAEPLEQEDLAEEAGLEFQPRTEDQYYVPSIEEVAAEGEGPSHWEDAAPAEEVENPPLVNDGLAHGEATEVQSV